MTPWTRRDFLTSCLSFPAAALISSSGAAHAAQGLGQFATPGAAAPCKLNEKATPAAPQGPEFKPGSPARASFIEPGVTGHRLVLTGTVSGLTCGPIKGAVVDFWQADAHGVYDRTGFHLRGHQSTDQAGHYRLETIVPGAVSTHAPHLNVRVKPPGKAVFATQIFFPEAPQNKKDAAFRSELVMKITDGRNGKTAAFDIVLNV
jgi:protocatechuate 3,4-dioxygenase beta subunit